MKKQFSWIVLFIAISLISCIFGCKEPEIETDTKAPANVTRLTVTATDGNAVLTWKNPSDADFDGVQVSMSPAEGTLKNAISLEKDVTSFEVIGLENGKEYTFTVKTIDTSNNKSSGVSAKATVADYTAPAEVIELTAIVSNENAVLTWKNPSDTDLAGIQISMNPAAGTLANTVSLGKDVTSLNASGLDSGVDYTFTVKTFDTSLNYSSGTTVKATAVDNFDKTAPAKVTGLTVTAADGDAVLTWKNPSDTDFAGVQISMSPSAGTLANTVSLGKDVTSLNISGIENGKEYTFTVKSFDTSLNYSEGATVTATVADTSDYVAPAKVTGLTVTAADGDAVLTWKNPSDTDFAGVQISMSPATGTLANAIILGKDVTSLNISGIENGVEYTFTVKTFDTSLNYSEGATVTATVADLSDYVAPAKVTSFTVTASNGNAVLSWKNPADADFAGVQVAMSPAEGTLKNAVVLGKEVTSLDVSGLTIGKEYTFTVKAFDESLNYSEGAEAKATVADTADYTAPADVTELTVQAVNGNAVLSWKNPADADFAGVQVAMSPTEGTLKNAIMLGKDVVSLDVSGLTVGKEYTFTVKAFDESLNYSEGVTAKATVADTADYTAPADVTELTATNKDTSVLLTWTDATDEDIYGYEVTWNKNAPINRSVAMEANSMMVAPGAKGCYISNLTNGTEYAFTVKSVDTSGNKSQGVTISITPSIIEKSALEITLVPNTTERTNKDVVITVNVTTDAASEIKKIAYTIGTESNIDTVLAGTNITETKQITATENTTFTVAVTDTAGRCELAFVTVNNIDKAAPAQVANVMPSYSRNDNTIKLSWTNPADKDFAGTEIVYGKTDSEKTTTLTFDKNTTSAAIKNIADDDSEYTIAIKTKDDVGNLGEAKTVTVVAATGAKITSVNLDRTHLDSIMTNRDIEVTIRGSKFNVLSSLLVQVTGETPVTAIIDAANNTATAIITAPVPESPTNNGTTYTVKVIADDILSETTASFVVSKPADVTSITLAKTQIPVGTQESVTATITGTNFDIRGVTKVKLLDSNGDEVIASTVTVPLESNTSKTKFTANIPLPTEKGTYTVAVFFDDVKDTTTTTLKIQPECAYKVGDIILTDGSKVSVNDIATYTIDENNKPIGVVAMITDINGVPTPKVIGLQKSASILMWAATNTTGYKTNFTNIVCEPNIICSGPASTATFTGDTEGSDNWAEICTVDPEGTQNAAKNYPAFNFANTYGTTAGLTGTDYEKGWYIPSVAELCEVYKNKKVIQTSLIKANGFEFGSSIYQSSSQDDLNRSHVYKVDFRFDDVRSYYKNYAEDVFVLHALLPKITSVNLDRTHLDSIMTNRDIDVTIRGIDFDFLSSLLVQVTDGTTSQTPVTAIIDAVNNTATATITAPVPESPTNNGTTYTVKVIADAILSETTASFVVSSPADVTSITLAQIPLGRGESVKATITGTNFDIRGVTKVKLLDSNGDEYTESTVTVPIANNTSNTEFTANIPLPAEVGTYTVAVFFDDVKDATTTTLEIQSECAYKVGDIILTDGTIVYVENVATYTIDENNKPIGVVAMITDINGVPTPKVIGLQKPANELVWAPENTIGYKTNFTNIVCTPSQNDIGAALTATFTGDTEGSDNWAEICAVDPTGTANAAKNYPIFNFANTYGTRAGLTGTDYEEGWYVPSIAELCEVYKNKEVIQTSLTKASGFEFCGDWYWSSSQNASSNHCVCTVGFNSGYVFSNHFKYNDFNVFVLRALTAK